MPVTGTAPVLVVNVVTGVAGVCVGAGVLVGATIAVIVRAEEKVATAKVWIWLTLKADVGVTSGAFPAPHEASRRAPSASRTCTFINCLLIIHTPFNRCRNKLRILFGISV
jgi:hypothetical protein